MMYPSLFSSDLVHYLLHGSILKSSRRGRATTYVHWQSLSALPCHRARPGSGHAVPRLRGSLVRDVCILYVSGDASGGHEKIESTRAGSGLDRAVELPSGVRCSRHGDGTSPVSVTALSASLYSESPARPACPVRAPLRRRHTDDTHPTRRSFLQSAYTTTRHKHPCYFSRRVVTNSQYWQ